MKLSNCILHVVLDFCFFIIFKICNKLKYDTEILLTLSAVLANMIAELLFKQTFKKQFGGTIKQMGYFASTNCRVLLLNKVGKTVLPPVP